MNEQKTPPVFSVFGGLTLHKRKPKDQRFESLHALCVRLRGARPQPQYIPFQRLTNTGADLWSPYGHDPGSEIAEAQDS